MGKADNFSEWYNEIVQQADLIDKRYPIKGMDVWRPYGWSIMRAIDNFTRSEMARTEHEEVMFPVFIPKTEFQKEADQIKGFGGEVYWVTHGGENELEVPLVVRPTSETAMYPMFSLWVRSHKDLPLKVYQIVQVFRYETKQTRSFLRVRQIHFFEAHTAHTDFEDAERQIHQDLDIWANLADKLCLPYLLHKRPEWDKFPGSFYSVGADAALPGNVPGETRMLQVATFHHYRDNFAKAYDIKYEGEDNETHYAHQTTYGMSERLLGAIVAVHGDDKGLMLPPDIAPYHAVVVPIIFKGKEAPVLEAAQKLKDDLWAKGFRVHADLRDETAGFKYNHWEQAGVPVRIEIGPRDLEKEQAVLVRRDNGEKTFVPLGSLEESLGKTLEAYKDGLTQRAWGLLKGVIEPFTDLDAAKAHKGIAFVGWCGDDACGQRMEEATDKKLLGTPVDVAFGEAFKTEAHGKLTLPSREAPAPVCAGCGEGAKQPAYLSKTY